MGVCIVNSKDYEYKLVNRTRISTSIDNNLLAAFSCLADETRINKSKLYDEAIEDLLKKIRQTRS
ncbi:MAG: ribbon-helix-helix domain-containing protein [Oscillospiraceae bacterium]|nr:ribbon-helix-helix domain-containing protein [Oscillospiraceae bacterium]